MAFQKYRWTTLPREIHAGHGVIERIGEVADRLGLGERAVMVTGPRTMEVAGRRVREVLEDHGYEVHEVICGQATEEELGRVKEVAEETSSAFMLGVGGGSKIDLAKKASSDLGIPFISVPTCASHDGIGSPRATIRKNGVSVSEEAQVPLAIVADSSIIIRAPYRYLAAGAGDVVGNLTALKDWMLAHKLRGEHISSTAYSISRQTVEDFIATADSIKPNLEESVWIVLKALISSGMAMCIAGSSRPASGSEHLFAHALEKVAPGKALHGEAVGLGTIMMMYLHGGDWEMVRDTLKRIGAPVRAADLGIGEEEIVSALTIAHRVRERYTILGREGLTEEAARKAAERTGII